MNKLIPFVLALALTACAPTERQKRCELIGAVTGAVIAGGSVVGIALSSNDCLGSNCLGQTPHEEHQSYAARRDTVLTYGVPPAMLVGAGIGAIVGYNVCRDRE